MPLSTADVDLELLLTDEHDPDDDGLLHGLHMQCQLDRDRPITNCGKEVSWLGLRDKGGPIERCAPCWDPDTRCPVCGSCLDKAE